MGLLSGLEKFGFQTAQLADMEERENQDAQKSKVKEQKEQKPQVHEVSETDFLMDKTVTCPICDKKFTVKAVRNAKLRRKASDADLRPNFEGIDTLKYDVWICPHCGYGAMIRFFDHISTAKAKLVRQEVCSQFSFYEESKEDTYSYDYAVDRYKLSLLSTMAKRGSTSEKAYTCLKIAWLRRSQLETLSDKDPQAAEKKAAYQEEFEECYREAYEGFIKATETEMPPFCGMDGSTVEFMLANMAMYYKKYDVASKLVGRLLTAPGTSKKMKDLCLDLKEEILVQIQREN